MSQVRVISSIDVHAEGEPGRVLLGLHLSVRGETMAQRLQWCIDHLDPLRRLLLQEPRGHPAVCAVLVLPPVAADADVSIVVLEQGGFRPMSGSNTMCAVTALLETGALPMAEPETVVRIDTAVGRVEAVARVRGRKVVSVQVRNVASFVVELDFPVDVSGRGRVLADVAFGGQFYVLAPAAAFDLDLERAGVPAVVRAGMSLLASARRQVAVRHPEHRAIDQISLVMLHGPAQTPGVDGRNCVVMPNGELHPTDASTWRGSLDRSPCGTGTSARMACLYARGDLVVGQPFVHQGVLGTTFTGLLHATATVGERPAVLPSVEGRAWITGLNSLMLDPDDPFPQGYTVGDVWSATSI
ncbi:MAG TPA: proline racemase family protein [Propionibacteriaceae bacterium]|nr:proline racemase family protein [Propionibacteriaceae bacterium]